MTDEQVPAIEIVKAMIEQIDSGIEIEHVKNDFDRMERQFFLSKDNRKCEVILPRALLDDLNDYTGSRESRYWKSLEGSLKLRLSIPIQISGLIPVSSDVFFDEQQDWEHDDGRRNIKVQYYADDYEIFQEGLKDLYHYLEEQKKALSHLKLINFPYDEDQQRIQEMLSYRNKQISENGSCPFRDNISVTSRTHLKAAALMRMIFYENELKKGHYSATVKKEITARMVKILSLLSSPVFEKIEIAEYLRGIKAERIPGQPKIVVPDDSRKPQYDVVISFAGEDRSYAKQLADLLQKDGFRFFYDAYEEDELWGKDLYEHLSYIYSQAGRYCVMFLSAYYAAKQWTRHERRSAQERAFKENREYILPIRIDDTSIPGILDTFGYQDLRQKSIEEIFTILKKKLLPSGDIVIAESKPDLKKDLGFSDDANKLLKLLSDKSVNGHENDPQLTGQDVIEALGLGEKEIGIAADELREKELVKLVNSIAAGKIGFRYIMPAENFFTFTDVYLQKWNPEIDSEILAKTLIEVAGNGHSASIIEIDNRLKWGPRRLNPALVLLIKREVVNPSPTVSRDYITNNVILQTKIHRYIKGA